MGELLAEMLLLLLKGSAYIIKLDIAQIVLLAQGG